MKYKVLITAPYFLPVIDRYKQTFEENGIEVMVPKVNERLSEEELLPLVGNVDGILCGDDRITEKVLDAAPRLRVIVKWGTGTDSIDKEAAGKRGVLVRNTPNAFTEPVADTIVGMILSFARGIVDLDRKLRKGKWEKKLNLALNECTVGIIGTGNIGQAVIRRLEPFGVKLLGNDIKEMPFDFMVSIEELLAASDFVVLSCDLNPTSHHIINEETVNLMKPTAYLINCARGPLVEESTLIEALNKGKIAGAGLDVFEDEPLREDHPFKIMENVILSPHNSNSSIKAWGIVHENSVSNLIKEILKHDK